MPYHMYLPSTMAALIYSISGCRFTGHWQQKGKFNHLDNDLTYWYHKATLISGNAL